MKKIYKGMNLQMFAAPTELTGAGNKELNTDTYKIESNTSNSGAIQPYIVVFFWRRTA